MVKSQRRSIFHGGTEAKNAVEQLVLAPLLGCLRAPFQHLLYLLPSIFATRFRHGLGSLPSALSGPFWLTFDAPAVFERQERIVKIAIGFMLYLATWSARNRPGRTPKPSPGM